MTNVLHVHMKRNAVMRTEFDEKMHAIEKTVKAAMDLADLPRKRADTAKNVADQAMKKK